MPTDAEEWERQRTAALRRRLPGLVGGELLGAAVLVGVYVLAWRSAFVLVLAAAALAAAALDARAWFRVRPGARPASPDPEAHAPRSRGPTPEGRQASFPAEPVTFAWSAAERAWCGEVRVDESEVAVQLEGDADGPFPAARARWDALAPLEATWDAARRAIAAWSRDAGPEPLDASELVLQRIRLDADAAELEAEAASDIDGLYIAATDDGRWFDVHRLG